MSDDVLEFTADPSGVAQVVGYDQFGRPVVDYWTEADLETALAEIARRKSASIRMTGNGSPVLWEADLLEMRAAVRRAQERER